jgi:transposase-like protein
MNTQATAQELPIPGTLQEAVIYFADADRCFEAAKDLRWPDGIIRCPHCGSERHSFISTRKKWKCKGCKKQFSVKVGSVFEDSPLGLDKWLVAVWLVAVWLLAGAKNGISSCELSRAIGVTQKTAWFMLQRIRLAMRTGSFEKLQGEVEADETYVGGKAKNMHLRRRNKYQRGRGGSGKTIVLGMLERKGRVVAKIVPNVKRKTLQAEVRQQVLEGSELFTDALHAYTGLDDEYAHRVVDHAEHYVVGKVHTNGLENFWTLLKRSITGTYVAVEPFHLERYLDEQAFRYNERREDDRGRFVKVMKGIGGKRLTYKEVTGKE